MKKIIVILLTTFSLYAQPEETSKPLLDQLSIWQPVTIQQLAIDLQNKTKDIPAVQMFQNTSASAGNNTAIIQQIGDENTAILFQTGSGNTNFIEQSGDDNKYLGLIGGDDNTTTASQTGDENLIQQLVMIDNSQFLLMQNGDNNRIYQEEISGPSREYEITQTGNNMTIFILNGKFFK